MNSKRITVYDIAERIGCSHATVSMALRNSPQISEKRREQVKRIAGEMGYAPDPYLASLAAYRRRNASSKIRSAIAWINHWDQPERLRKQREFNLYWCGAAEAAKRFGYHLDEIHWSQDYNAKRFEQILLTRNIRGVLIPPHRESPDWGDFHWNKFSIIRFGLSVSEPDSHLVTADQLRAVMMAIRKIKNYGYKRIGLVVSDDYEHLLGGNFIGGFAAAQQLLKLPSLPPLMTSQIIYREQPDKAQKALRQWMNKNKPDAILTVVPEIPAMLRVIGYQIPEDVAVAGTSSDVPVDAGIDRHSEAIGRIAVEMLVAQINLNERGEPPDPCRILVESRWRDGNSLPNRAS